LLKRTVLVARAQTALYLVAGLISISPKERGLILETLREEEEDS
jgi:hypothetical protein